jgi:hypothetical protein
MTTGDMIFWGLFGLVFAGLGAMLVVRLDELISWLRILVICKERAK